MRSASEWMDLLARIGKDERLNVWHLSLIIAVVQLAYCEKESAIVHVSRSKIMELSHIHTFPTYHKYFKELQDFGYIKYTPSYHPSYRSIVEFLIP